MSERLLELRFPARASELKQARQAVKQTLLACGIGEGGVLAALALLLWWIHLGCSEWNSW